MVCVGYHWTILLGSVSADKTRLYSYGMLPRNFWTTLHTWDDSVMQGHTPLCCPSPLLSCTSHLCFHVLLVSMLADFPPATRSLLVIPWLLFTTVGCQIPLYQDKLWANATLGSLGLTLTQPFTACAVSAAAATQAVFRAAGQCRYPSACFLKGQASNSPRMEMQVGDLWSELNWIK